jgi:hypothetical protein
MLSLDVICNEASTQATLASRGCTRDAHGGQATGGIRTDRYSGGKHIPEMMIRARSGEWRFDPDFGRHTTPQNRRFTVN